MEWIAEHWNEIGLIIGGVVTTASVIVKLTPTPKDDKALAKVVRLLNVLALNPKQAKK